MAKSIFPGFPVPQNDYYKVYVRSITYNQAPYIEDCMNGVAMQQTDFPFVHHVIDDCSTDGEQEVIKTYLNNNCDIENAEYYDNDICSITIAMNKSNPNCTLAVYFLKRNLYRDQEKKKELYALWREVCPYEALCEGDDFWIDPQKLKKQVNWLEFHPEYTMCCSDAKVVTHSGEENWHRYDHDSDVNPQDMIMGGGLFVQTASLLYRNDLLDNYPVFCKECHVGDYPLQIWATLNGKVRYFAKKMAVYRYACANSWTSKVGNQLLDKEIKGCRSEMDMLQGLNQYSNYKYNNVFINREIHHIDVFLHSRIDDWKVISYCFSDIVRHFGHKQKVENWLRCHGLRHLADSWLIYCKQGVKDGVYSLPILKSIIPIFRSYKNKMFHKVFRDEI